MSGSRPEYKLEHSIDKLEAELKNLQFDDTELEEKGGAQKRRPQNTGNQHLENAKKANTTSMPKVIILPPSTPTFSNVTSPEHFLSLPQLFPPQAADSCSRPLRPADTVPRVSMVTGPPDTRSPPSSVTSKELHSVGQSSVRSPLRNMVTSTSAGSIPRYVQQFAWNVSTTENVVRSPPQQFDHSASAVKNIRSPPGVPVTATHSHLVTGRTAGTGGSPVLTKTVRSSSLSGGSVFQFPDSSKTLPCTVDTDGGQDNEEAAINKLAIELMQSSPQGPPDWLSTTLASDLKGPPHDAVSSPPSAAPPRIQVPQRSSLSSSVVYSQNMQSPPGTKTATSPAELQVCYPPPMTPHPSARGSLDEMPFPDVTLRNLPAARREYPVTFTLFGYGDEDKNGQETFFPKFTATSDAGLLPSSFGFNSSNGSSASLASIGSSGSERLSGGEQNFLKALSPSDVQKRLGDLKGSNSSISSGESGQKDRDSGIYEFSENSASSPPVQGGAQVHRSLSAGEGGEQGWPTEEGRCTMTPSVNSPQSVTHQSAGQGRVRSRSGTSTSSRLTDPDGTVRSPGSAASLQSPCPTSPTQVQSPQYSLPPTPLSPTGIASSQSMSRSVSSSSSHGPASWQASAPSPHSPVLGHFSPQSQHSPMTGPTVVENSPHSPRVVMRSPTSSVSSSPGNASMMVNSPPGSMRMVNLPTSVPPMVVNSPPRSMANAPANPPVMMHSPGIANPRVINPSPPPPDLMEDLSPDEVISAAIAEDGRWIHSDNGENCLHALSGLPDQHLALQILALLQGKGQFQMALNEMSRGHETPLYSAVWFNRTDLARAFLMLGADVNCVCQNEMPNMHHTSLHLAVEKGFAEIVEALLEWDATDVNATRTPDNLTPLMVALKQHMKGDRKDDRSNIIKMLIEASSDFEIRERSFNIQERSFNKTALMMAVESKDVEVVRLILESAGVEDARRLINQHRTRSGSTALHIAAGLHNISTDVKEKILQLLIQFGGDTGVKNNEGDTPKDYDKHLVPDDLF
nr:hypothetical protein BaRGS_034849 [Batillaria attramentaria]